MTIESKKYSTTQVAQRSAIMKIPRSLIRSAFQPWFWEPFRRGSIWATLANKLRILIKWWI